jgi:hypothetical protein
MALPETIRIKLSTEEAGSITITPVVVQEIALRDLVEHMLAVTGKDLDRVRELLLRGTLVSGASRFRWTGLETEPSAVGQLLGAFPDPDPARAFQAGQCVRAVLRGPTRQVDLPREAAMKKPLLRRTSFWDVLMQAIGGGDLSYGGYSYRERADWYRARLGEPDWGRLRERSTLLRYSTLRDQVLASRFDSVELYAHR